MNVRVPQHLHQPMQILWFDTNEWVIIVSAYLAAVVFGLIAGVLALFFSILLIQHKRARPRGYFHHIRYELGLFAEIEGYPLPTANVFNE